MTETEEKVIGIFVIIFVCIIIPYLIFVNNYKPTVILHNCNTVIVEPNEDENIAQEKIIEEFKSCAELKPTLFENLEVHYNSVNTLPLNKDSETENSFTTNVYIEGLLGSSTSIEMHYKVKNYKNINNINNLMDYCRFDEHMCYSKNPVDSDMQYLYTRLDELSGKKPEDVYYGYTYVYLNDDYSIKRIDKDYNN